LKKVLQELQDECVIDGDHAGKLKRIEELKMLIGEKNREFLQATEESFRLQMEHDELKISIKNQKDQLDYYIEELERVKILRAKEEKVVAKKLRELAGALEDAKRQEGGLLSDIKGKDDKVIELKKKVDELKREKLNADWVSLQEEITEYRVILGGWKDVIKSPIRKAVSRSVVAEESEEGSEEGSEVEMEEEEAPVKLGKRKRDEATDAGDQDNDTPCVVM